MTTHCFMLYYPPNTITNVRIGPNMRLMSMGLTNMRPYVKSGPSQNFSRGVRRLAGLNLGGNFQGYRDVKPNSESCTPETAWLSLSCRSTSASKEKQRGKKWLAGALKDCDMPFRGILSAKRVKGNSKHCEGPTQLPSPPFAYSCIGREESGCSFPTLRHDSFKVRSPDFCDGNTISFYFIRREGFFKLLIF
jgi:hypothetical protein